MEIIGRFRRLTAIQRNTFIACFLGWSLDAFDFFILIFCIPALSTHFEKNVSTIAEAVFWTLAMRPVGAFLFGMMADRWGRRPTLILNIVCYSFFELASAFAPNLQIFLITRALFGIGMGGEWGVGAALAFETLPAEGRGFFSGLLQEGYVAGYLLAALVYGTLFSFVGWRGMFVIGALPAVLVIFILSKVEESPAWAQGKVERKTERRLWIDMGEHGGAFLFLVVLMFAFNSFSHGTQDLYPTFLQKNLNFAPKTVSLIAIIYSLGALAGGICFGSWSEKIGRKRAIVIAAMLSIPAIPLWAFSHSVPVLAAGGFLMQFMVQGAWGVIPAHLNELSPPSVRGTLPGFAYQLGNLLSSRNSVIQAKVTERHYGGNYAPVLAWTVLIIALLVTLITLSGRERRGADLSTTR
ncbi:MAG TPA: MFS transporter [Candidatus Sulfotelmatobacter sp.]|nr:MFS transporter [Candidatus Sulfotelmatobacter sp.]